jgi:hypothetical protein
MAISCRYDRLDEHDKRMEEKQKEAASRQPSLKLTKVLLIQGS